MRGRVRLVEVAERAGVTVSTASRALNRPEMVRPETRARVEAVALELGYEPNRAARSLITGRTATIVLVVPDLANTYFALIARAAQDLARSRGYEVMIIDTGRDPAREREIVRSTSQWADGLIICASQRPHPPNPNGTPIVFVNRRVRGSHAVIVDQRTIVETQLRHLLDLGHRRIVWASGPKDYWASEPRRRCAARFAARHEVRIAPPVAADFEGGVELAEQLGQGITAVATFNDRQAFGLMTRCLQLGIRIPEDLSVIGSDNVPSADFVNPGLTTVHAPKEEMGRAAVSLLLDHLSDEGPCIVETLRGHLVVRGSTAPPPGG